MLFKLIIPFLLLLGVFLLWRRWAAAQREGFIEQFAYGKVLDARLAARHPALSAEQRGEVLQGLKEYFLLCLRARRKMVAMPSQAVDDAWHEFILFTRQYDKFCRAAFGRFLHHTPAEAMTSPTQASNGIKRAWRLACAHEGINPQAPDRLPRLFALDAALTIAGGFIYQLDCLAAGQNGLGSGFCASHIGCGGGCSGDSGSSDGDSGGCGGGCGGD